MKVTVFSTKGNKRSVIESTATVWGELKKELETVGVPTKGMKAIIGQTKTTLESNQAILPVDFDFTLFLSPIKVKSGTDLAYNDCKAEIKKIIKTDEANRVYFPAYTNSSTSAMNKMLKKYYKANVTTKNVEEEIIEETVEQACNVVVENLELIISQVTAIRDKSIEGTTTIKEEDLIKELETQFAEIQASM